MASGSSITPSSLSPSELPNVRLCAYFPYNFQPEGKKEGDKQAERLRLRIFGSSLNIKFGSTLRGWG